jgi:hypothetical protein
MTNTAIDKWTAPLIFEEIEIKNTRTYHHIPKDNS